MLLLAGVFLLTFCFVGFGPLPRIRRFKITDGLFCFVILNFFSIFFSLLEYFSSHISMITLVSVV